MGKAVKEEKQAKEVKEKEKGTTEITDPAKVYVIKEGSRQVLPYWHKYRTHTKGRWLGKSIMEVFEKELREKPASYYAKAIQNGLITIDGKACSKDTVLKIGNAIEHTTHRHEPAVVGDALQVVVSSEKFVVINKPASIPTHPTGRFKYNTVQEILHIEHGYDHLMPVNRIDRPTSGIIIFARDSETASIFCAQLRDRNAYKEYYARVIGEFPADDEIVCEEPLNTISFRMGLSCVDRSENGKPSKTVFKRLAYNGTTSLVQCMYKLGFFHCSKC